MSINTSLIFPLQPNWTGPTMDATVERIGVLMDSKVGRAESRLPSLLPTYRKRFELILDGTEPETARTWIETYLQGRWKAFWMPTWISDFAFNASIGSSATSFTCNGVDRHSRWSLSNGRRTIVAILPNGTKLYSHVTSITGTGYGTETVSISPAFGTAVPTTALICWLMWGRCDQDELELEWQDGLSVATFGFDFVELPWEQPEAIT